MQFPFLVIFLLTATFSEQDISVQNIRGRNIYSTRTCNLHLIADHKVFGHYFRANNERNPAKTRRAILALFQRHVDSLNEIFESTNFQGIRGVNFLIAETTIFDHNSCIKKNENFSNPFCKETASIEDFLKTSSKRNFSEFCLVFTFTFRDFKHRSLGLAYGSENGLGEYGGICESYREFMDQETKKRFWRSSNTGVVTLSSNAHAVSPLTSRLTFAHEIGHSFGAPHDYSSRCRAGHPYGDFLMSPSSNPGHLPNHSKFSQCSVANMSNLLFKILSKNPAIQNAEDVKRNCFIETRRSLCGNQIMESNEECDCGVSDSECLEKMNDPCCYPASHALGCTLKPSASCSSSQGPCCDDKTCQISTSNTSCKNEKECSFESYCDGESPKCPVPRNKPNRSLCRQNTMLCVNGHCDVSVCAIAGFRQCQITTGNQAKKCQLGCQMGSRCKSSFEISQLKPFYHENTGNQGIILPRNAPCDDYEGKCDLRNSCRPNHF